MGERIDPMAGRDECTARRCDVSSMPSAAKDEVIASTVLAVDGSLIASGARGL